MNGPFRSRPRWGSALLLAALALVTAAPGLRAQNPACPPPTVTIQIARPTANAINLGGTIRVDLTNTAIPTGYAWQAMWLNVYDSGNVRREVGTVSRINSTTCYYNCVTKPYTNGSYKFQATGTLINLSTNALCDVPPSAMVPLTTFNAPIDRHTSKAELDCACRRDCVPTGSSTSPLTGAQSFSVPISSWELFPAPPAGWR